uniref:Large ribosomal subunit protein bL35c n=1 Tax=Compsopogon caeruleus TaxID=31354 RepID=A0A1Z1XB31_9RHOD|nr:ribosomal protein L35 [Compsopogon caeruleus]ARX96072.1 ribosomal protein L35 [Compsopogon caeruleus]
MPKLKTKKSILKRFKIVNNHTVLRKRAGKNHLLEKKNSERKQNLFKAVLLTKTYCKKILSTIVF